MDRLSSLTEPEIERTKVLDVIRFAGLLTNNEGFPQLARQQFIQRWPNSLSAPLLQRWDFEAKAPIAGMTPLNTPALIPAPMATAFARFVAPFTLLGRFGTGGVPALLSAPFDTRVVISDPRDGSFGWIDPGHPKPVRAGAPIAVTLRAAKVGGILVTSDEIRRFAATGAAEHLRDLSVRSLALAMDRVLVDPTIAATGTSPASLTTGAVAIPSSGNAHDDLRALLLAYTTAGGSLASAVILIGSTNAAALALDAGSYPELTASGGRLAGLPALASDAVEDLLIIVDTSRVVLADEGAADFSVSTVASFEMEDQPTNAVTDDASPAAPIHTNVVSMWQTNSVALRVERILNWLALPDAVQYVSGAAYLTTGSPGA